MFSILILPMIRLPLFLLLITNFFCFSQKINYIDYHKDINKAEALFFIENKTDSALYYYDKVFKEFDFIFVKDLLNAAQIASYSKKPHEKYIEQGFQQGLKISHLKNYPLLNKLYNNVKRNKKLIKSYTLNRNIYIDKIDFKYLDFIYKIAIKDQKNKYVRRTYGNVVYKTTERLRDSILKKGFPGDRVIGITDSTIFKEIGKSYLDLYHQRKKEKKLWYMTSDEGILSSKYPIILLIHNRCSYFLYKDLLIKEMEKGNIHPRDIGLLHDNMYGFVNNFPPYCTNVSLKSAYLLNQFIDYSKLTNINNAETDTMRKELYIVSLDVDQKKKEYEVKYGFKLFSGFWSCR